MSYINEYTSLTPEELRQLKYKRKYKEENPEWDDSMVKLTNLVRERIANNAVVLDFGCGRGNFVIDELKDRFSKKIGFDLDQASVIGNQTNDEIIIGSDDTKLPFSENTFDVVISLWVFEHLQNPEFIFDEINRVLKPGGFLAFVTPNRNSFLIWLRRFTPEKIAHIILKKIYGREEKDVFGVYYRANAIREITTLAENSNFTIEVLITNPDPSYTSFGRLTYKMSKFLAKHFPQYFQPHIIVVLRKKS